MKLFLLISLFCSIWNIDDYSDAQKLYDNKQYQASIDICNKALQSLQHSDPLFEKFLFLRVSSYIETQNFQAGIQDFLTLTSINPNKVDYYVGLSYMYGQMGNYKDC